jgi:predicted dehydrogenase
VVPSYVLGLRGQTAPSSKLNIAGIGIGGQGGSDLSSILKENPGENIVALADVDWRHAGGTFKRHPDARQYKDYRKMLDEVKEIDAVVVATPDHMHAPASVAALRRGKHVYCEKPLTHSVWEARKVAEVARQARWPHKWVNQGAARGHAGSANSFGRALSDRSEPTSD